MCAPCRGIRHDALELGIRVSLGVPAIRPAAARSRHAGDPPVEALAASTRAASGTRGASGKGHRHRQARNGRQHGCHFVRRARTGTSALRSRRNDAWIGRDERAPGGRIGDLQRTIQGDPGPSFRRTTDLLQPRAGRVDPSRHPPPVAERRRPVLETDRPGHGGMCGGQRGVRPARPTSLPVLRPDPRDTSRAGPHARWAATHRRVGAHTKPCRRRSPCWTRMPLPY